MRTRLLLPALLSVAACSLHRRPPAPVLARGPARDSLLRLDQTRGDSVAARGPIDGVLALLAPDVVYLRANAPAVYGRDGTRALLTASPAAIPPGTSWQPLGGAVSRDVRAGYTFGVVGRVAQTDRGRPAIQFEHYIAFWQRGPGCRGCGGSAVWRITAYAELNAPPSPEVSLSTTQTTPPDTRLTGAMAGAAQDVRDADRLFADLNDRAGLATAMSTAIAPTGVLFAESRLVVGPAAVRELYEERPSGMSLTWQPVYASVAQSLDLAFTIDESVSTERGPSGAAIQRFGKHLTVWQRQGGDWKFVINGGNQTR